jgi:hypothetical protein
LCHYGPWATYEQPESGVFYPHPAQEKKRRRQVSSQNKTKTKQKIQNKTKNREDGTGLAYWLTGEMGAEARRQDGGVFGRQTSDDMRATLDMAASRLRASLWFWPTGDTDALDALSEVFGLPLENVSGFKALAQAPPFRLAMHAL